MVKVLIIIRSTRIGSKIITRAAKSFLTELLAAMKPEDVWYDNTDAMMTTTLTLPTMLMSTLGVGTNNMR